MTGFFWQAVGVMLVRGKSRPAALPHCEQFADQQTPHFIMLFLAQNMFDFAMRFRIIRAVLNQINIRGTHLKRVKHLIIFCARDEHFALI